MAKFDIVNKWPTRRKTSRQKDPREQERYCHISFFDGWQRVELEEVAECKGDYLLHLRSTLGKRQQAAQDRTMQNDPR